MNQNSIHFANSSHFSVFGDNGHIPYQGTWSVDQRTLKMRLLFLLTTPVLGEQAW